MGTIIGDGRQAETYTAIVMEVMVNQRVQTLIIWIRSGRPLMRKTSANKFILGLEIDAELNKPGTREEVTTCKSVNVDENGSLKACSNSILIQSPSKGSQYKNSRSCTPESSAENSDFGLRDFGSRVPAVASSITISEGDLLQPEMIHNGVVFSV